MDIISFPLHVLVEIVFYVPHATAASMGPNVPVYGLWFPDGLQMSLTNPPSSSGPLTAPRPAAATVSQTLSLKRSLQSAVDGNILVSYIYLNPSACCLVEIYGSCVWYCSFWTFVALKSAIRDLLDLPVLFPSCLEGISLISTLLAGFILLVMISLLSDVGWSCWA